MYKKSYSLLLAAFMLFAGIAQGQITNYDFAATIGNFTPLVGGTIGKDGAASLYRGTDYDDGALNGIPIGFNFKLNGVTYSTISTSYNSVACLGGDIEGTVYVAALVDGNTHRGIGNQTVPRPILAALWDDTYIGDPSKVTFLTTGNAPNRVFTLQYLQVKWDYASGDDAISYQIKLYETTNVIQFIYKSGASAPNRGAAAIGITDQGIGEGTFLSVSDLSVNATISSTSQTKNIGGIPADGLTFTFTPPPCSADPVTLPICIGNSIPIEVSRAGGTATFSPATGLFIDAQATIPYVANSSATIVYAKPSTTTTYTKTINGGRCIGYINDVTIDVTNPQAKITAFPFYNLLPGLYTNLNVESGPKPASEIVWYKNGNIIENNLPLDKNTRVYIDDLGAYSAKVTDNVGCVVTSSVVNIGDSSSATLFLYPNPNNGIFNIRYGGTKGNTGAIAVAVFDQSGAKVYAKQYTVSSPYSKMEVNIKSMAKGKYLLILYDKDGKVITTENILYK